VSYLPDKNVGNIHAALALAFHKDFPLVEETRRVMIREFDFWGIRQGEISPLPEGYDYDNPSKKSAAWQRLVKERNDLKRRINIGVCSAEFRTASGADPFAIEIETFGVSYVVCPAVDSVRLKAKNLPEKVKTFLTTKQGRIRQLRNSIAPERLTANQITELGKVDYYIRRAVRVVNFHLDEYGMEIDALLDSLEESARGEWKVLTFLPPAKDLSGGEGNE